MYGKKVKLRLTFLTVLILSLGLTIYLVLVSLKENVVYFLSPTEIKALSELKKDKIRIGGMVIENSINPRPKSGKQEALENYVNRFV